jgi:hypothetical protein
VAGVHRADRCHDRPRFERSEVRDDELRAVEEIERHPVALLHAQLGERASEAVGGLAELAVGDLPAVEDDRRPRRRALGRLVERLRDRLQRGVNGLRHPGLVELKPGLAEILGSGVHGLLPPAILAANPALVPPV